MVQQGELRRQGAVQVGDGGVDAEGVRPCRRANRCPGPLQHAPGGTVEVDGAKEEIQTQARFSHQLRQASLTGVAAEVQLEEAVLGVDVAQGEIGVRIAVGEYVGDAPPVAHDFNRVLESLDGAGPVELGQRPPRQMAEGQEGPDRQDQQGP